MLSFLSWPVIGAAVGLAVYALAHNRQFLGASRAVTLGVLGGMIGGLAGVARVGADGWSGGQPVVTGLASGIGALTVTWAYLAYSIRWESHALGGVPLSRPAGLHPDSARTDPATAPLATPAG
jgi:hypothetical protein